MEQCDLETVLPPEHLRPFVRRYFYANRKLETPLSVRATPTGYTYLTSFLELDELDHAMIDGETFTHETRWFFLGQITDQEVVLHRARTLRVVVCELAATGHYRLFGLSGRQAIGLAASMSEALPGCEAIALACFRLGREAPRESHIGEANLFFSRLAEQALPADPVVEYAVDIMERRGGAVRIGEICRDLGVAPRLLNRRFTHIVGVSPKFFARVMQINRVVGLLYSEGATKLAHIAQEAGFYDQAHFSHAMRHFFHEGAREFIRSDHSVYRTFLTATPPPLSTPPH